MHFNEKQKPNSSSDADQENDQYDKTCSTIISEHLDQYNQISATQAISQERAPLQILLEHENIWWDDNFESTIKVSILETDIESYHLHLHYGNLKIKLNVLMTNLDRGFYQQPQLGRGSFGTIYELVCESEVMNICVIKRIELKFRQYEIDLKEVYKEYFLSFLASVLKIGSKVLSPFGYDIIVTKNSAFFVMQKCQSFRSQQSDMLKSSITADLKYLHRLKFVHLDIKPQNIMYSRTFNKYVFIDFGLSLINSEAIGFKTKTSFLGTLKYCSDEMKKLYMIRNSGYVDLYHNDAVALHKSLKDLEIIMMSLKRNYIHNQVESLQQYELALRYTSQSIPVFRLKYFLFKNEIDHSVFYMNKIRHLKKTLISILGNRQRQQNLQQVFAKTYSEIFKLLFDGKYEFNFFDEMMGSEFKDLHIDLISSYSFKFESLLQLSQERFAKVLLNEKSVYEIFLCFDPFFRQKISKAYQLKSEGKQQDKLSQYKLIEKIYKALKQEQTPLKSKKVHRVIKFFYQKLKSFYTPALLDSFKVLFMIIQDWVSLQSAEFEILCVINDPILKMLKICWSIFYWNLMWQSSYIKNSKILREHVEKMDVLSIPLSQQQLQYFLQIKSLLISAFKSQSIQELTINTNHLFVHITTSFGDGSVFERNEYKEEVNNIRSLHGQSIIKQRKKKDENVWITMIKFQLNPLFESRTATKFEFRDSAFRSLISMKRQIQQLSINSCNNSKINLLISYFFETFSYRNDLVSLTTPQNFYDNLFQTNPQSLDYFNQRYIENFEKVFYDKKHNSLVDCNYIYIHFSSSLRLLLKCWSAKSNQFLIAARISSVLDRFNEHKIVRKMIDSNNYCLLAYRLCVAYLSFLQLKKQRKDVKNELYNRIADVGQTLTQMKGCPIVLESAFISLIFQTFRVLEENGKCQARFEEVFISSCREYFKKLSTLKFEKTHQILIKFIQTLNKNELYSQSFVILAGLAHFIDHVSMFYFIVMPSFIESVGMFCITASKQNLLTIYKENRFQKKQITNGSFAYLMFLMFHKVFSILQTKQRSRQLKRSVLSSQTMKQFPLICLKSVIYGLLLTENKLMNKRKQHIVKKLECRYAHFNRNPNTNFTYLIDINILLIKKKVIQKKLEAKVQMLNQLFL